VNSHRLPFVDVVLSYFNKLLDNCVLRAAAVRKLHLMHFDALTFKLCCFVQLVIKTDNPLYFSLEEMAHKVTGSDILSTVFVVARSRRGKCDYLPGNYPAQIATL
jgi:hypothetical protein